MAATTTEPTPAPRYAPEDPSLPKPWKGLVDGTTGYHYYWNPVTNVTQYEKPSAGSKGSSQQQKSSSVAVSSSVQVQQSSKQENGFIDDDRYGKSSNGGSKLSSGTRGYESTRTGSYAPNGTVAAGPGGSGLSPDAYRKRHEITVTGADVPPPFTSFEDTGFPSELLRELQEGAKCRTLCCHPILLKRGCIALHIIWCNVEYSYTVDQSSEKGFPNHPWSWMVVILFASLVRLKEEASSFWKLLESYWILPDAMKSDIFKEVAGSLVLFQVLEAGFTSPTPIQAQSWPVALQSRDIVAIAKTGSGKTLGYLIPGFIHLKRVYKNRQMGPTVLVLSPTRELATQIQAEAIKFGKSSKILCTCLYGGAPKGPQLRELDRGTDIVVATPGRLNDIIEMRRINLSQVTYLVLDEADRMLDMGFEPQIRKIVNMVPTRRQTLMYTATWPKEVRKIAADLLVNPIQVNIGNVDELVANKAITQHIEVLAPMEKHKRLEQILRSQEPRAKIIIFCSTKKMCDQLARTLTRQFSAAAIHGDKSQGERDYVLNQFRSGRSPVLVATDVAARGLDIKDIRVVINYDFPTGVEDYVHRIGRTGRAGATGEAYTFFGDQDSKHASELVKLLEGSNQRVPVEIRNMAARGGGKGARFNRWGSGSSFGGGGGRGGGGGGFGGRSSWGGGGGGRDSNNRIGGGGYNNNSSNNHKRFDESNVVGGGGGGGRARSRSRSPERFGLAPKNGFRPRFRAPGADEEEEGMIRE
ncbi:unnamed protein product [Lactuca saligna]|uniref:RNA helicase n=1 Tax=Lactuca saligna TaxID=75948 RepID=A0AA35UVE5_LACSI|nr:unnamed protein product [Lactuca saligna]